MNSGLETRRLGFSEQLHCNLFRDLEQIPWPLSFLGLGVGGTGGELEGSPGSLGLAENDMDSVGDYRAVLSHPPRREERKEGKSRGETE